MIRLEYVNYEAPIVEVIEVEVEKGFAVSPGNGGNLVDYGNDGTI